MHETNDFAAQSQHEGRMHGCGHDGHTTMLLGAARYLAETRNFDGTAYLIFQPGEEGCGGAQGDDRGRPVRALPGRRGLRAAQLARPAAGHDRQSRPGPMMAAADEIEITIDGTRRPRRACRTSRSTGAGRRRTSSPRCRRSSAATSSPIDTAVVSLCAMQAATSAR